ncbi:MAG: DUF6044 family protein [Desulfovibrio sp.]|jgi:hypothetical protein|nr:DUF6044 family protein [Desulfovibrio sp.]
MKRNEAGRFLVCCLAALAVICLFNRDYFLQWPDIPIYIHDFLDMILPWKHLGAGLFFNSDMYREFIPAKFTATGNYLNLHWGGFFFVFLPPVPALLIHKISCHFAGFCGMYLFLDLVLPPIRPRTLFRAVFALQYALLPLFYDQIAFTGTASVPLLAWALLGITLRGWSRPRAAVLCLCPFFGFLLHAPAFLFLVHAAFLGYWKMSGHSPRNGAQALTIGVILFLASHYDYILMATGYGGFVLNRVDYMRAALNRQEDYSLGRAAAAALSMLIRGQYHVPAFQTWILLPVCSIVCAGNILRLEGRRPAANKTGLGLSGGRDFSQSRQNIPYGQGFRTAQIQTAFFLAIVFCALAFGFFSWLPVISLKSALPVLGLAQMRFWYLNQIFWYACFALSCCQIFAFLEKFASRRASSSALLRSLAFLPLVLLTGAQFIILDLRARDSMPKPESSFYPFFAPDLFARVEATLPEKKETFRTLTFGMSPTVTSFNGFRGIDLYEPAYSLEHKRAFRAIIAAELEKDPVIREYFDDWGARCYLFQAKALGWMRNEPSPQPLDIDVRRMLRLGARYILSSVAIDLAHRKDLEEISRTPRLSPKESLWETIYVYRVRP